MRAVLLVLLILLVVSLVQAMVWIPLLRKWRRRSQSFVADFRAEAAASGERLISGPEKAVYRGGTGPYGAVKGNGTIILTDRRLVFVGVPPVNHLVPDDGPAASERREFPLDTLTRVVRTRVFAGAAPGVLFSARGAAEAFGLPTESRGAADTIVRVLERRQAVSRASASRDRRAQEYAAWLARLPIWHRVERGEALSTLATRYNTTVEQLRAVNGLPDDRVRIGQRLIVKPQT